MYYTYRKENNQKFNVLSLFYLESLVETVQHYVSKCLRFGVCCVFQITDAGREITENCTYIQNPGFPAVTTETNALTFNVRKCSDGKVFRSNMYNVYAVESRFYEISDDQMQRVSILRYNW